MSGLAQAYIDGDAFARGLFERPLTPALDGQDAPWAYGIAEACREYTQLLGAERPLPSGPVVITGQQTGLLGGPLYTVLKAITAIKLAERLARESGTVCTPVFWLAGDDHDFEEVRSVTVLTKVDEPLTLSWRPEADVTNRAMHRVPLDASLDAIIQQAADATRGSEWREPMAASLMESRARYESLCDWTGAVLARLFAETPLVFFAPHLEPGRFQAVGVLAREIEEPLASTRLLLEAGQALEAKGFEAPLQKRPDQCQFFMERGEVRQSVRFRDGEFHLGNGERFSPLVMRRLLDDEPGSFSAGAALRPIVQQALFPAAAYVAGPGEIAYWAQLRPLFEYHGQPMPSVYPRARAVLLSAKDRQHLEELGWTPGTLFQPRQDLVTLALRSYPPTPDMSVLRAEQAKVNAALGNASAALATADARSQDMLRRVSEKTARGLERIERAMLHADTERLNAVRARVERLQNRIAPHRKPQERVYGSVSWLFEQGWEFVPRLLDLVALDEHGVQEIVL